MRKKMTCFIARGRDGKKSPHRLGTIDMETGRGWINSLPVGAWDGSFLIEDDTPREDRRGGGAAEPFNDDIPFLPETRA